MNANRSQTSALVGVLFSLLTASQALQAGAAAPCAVGLELKPGESCDLSDGETFSIRDDGCVGEQPAVAVRQGGFSLLVGSRSRYTTWNKGPDGEQRNVKTVTCISGYIEIDGFRASEIRETCGDILPRPDCSWQIDRLPQKDAVEARLTEELFASIKDGYVDGVRQALEAGAKADATRRAGASALLAAMGPGNTEIVQLLIEAGADVNYVLPSQPYGSGAATGMSALLAAVGQGNAEIVQLLIEAGADVNYALPEQPYGSAAATGMSALVAAVGEGNAEIVQLLVEAGGELNHSLPLQPTGSKFPRGMSALLYSVEAEHVEVVSLLIGAGADVNQVYPEQLQNASTVDMLVPAEKNEELGGMSPLIRGALRGNEKIVGLLIGAGADVDYEVGRGDGFTKQLAGLTALRAARAGDHEGIVGLLRAAGAK